MADAVGCFRLAVDETGAQGIDKNRETVEVRATDANHAEENAKTCL